MTPRLDLPARHDDSAVFGPPFHLPPPTGSTPLPPPPPASRARRRLARAGAVVAIAGLSLTGGAVGATVFGNNDGGASATSASPTVKTVSLPARGASVTDIVNATRSSVVSIETEITVRRGPFEQSGSGAGTGIVLAGGYVLTNAHVVADATSVKVTGADGTARAATIVGSDTSADVAVLHVDDATGLVPAPIDRSGSTVVGEDVVAIGNALALEGGLTVTKGIVSGLDRSIESETGTLTHLIQTDAAISSGNSGGPLLDAGGQVIGMNAAVATSSGTVAASNIGFAIDINRALSVAEQLIGHTP